MITVKEGNLFNTAAPIIAHQVNCQGVMGSGVAKQIKDRYPDCFTAYKNSVEKSHALLGDICWWTNGKVSIANMFAQYKYGYDKKKYTCVKSFKDCVDLLKSAAVKSSRNVAMPYNIGCCRGGADWNTEIYPILEEAFKDAPITLELWRLDDK